jgi:hypothetical protein
MNIEGFHTWTYIIFIIWLTATFIITVRNGFWFDGFGFAVVTAFGILIWGTP